MLGVVTKSADAAEPERRAAIAALKLAGAGEIFCVDSVTGDGIDDPHGGPMPTIFLGDPERGPNLRDLVDLARLQEIQDTFAHETGIAMITVDSPAPP